MDALALDDAVSPVREEFNIVPAAVLSPSQRRDGGRVSADDGWEFLRDVQDVHGRLDVSRCG
jgi:hypothetical protein